MCTSLHQGGGGGEGGGRAPAYSDHVLYQQSIWYCLDDGNEDEEMVGSSQQGLH